MHAAWCPRAMHHYHCNGDWSLVSVYYDVLGPCVWFYGKKYSKTLDIIGGRLVPACHAPSAHRRMHVVAVVKSTKCIPHDAWAGHVNASGPRARLPHPHLWTSCSTHEHRKAQWAPRVEVNGAPSETWQNEEYVVIRMRICYEMKWRVSYKMKRPWGENEKWYGNTKNKTNEPFTNETNVPCPFLRDGVDDNNTVWEIERLKCKMNE